VQINQITKSGGNMFSGTLFGAYTNDHFQNDNLDDSQRAMGPLPVLHEEDLGLQSAIGGPLERDKVWFFYSYRYWGTNDQPQAPISTPLHWTSHSTLTRTTRRLRGHG
jgi:hypothetical protein